MQFLNNIYRGGMELIKNLKFPMFLEPKCNMDKELISACEKGDFEIVKYLVEKGADLHIENNFPLRNACRYGHLEIVKFLVENGANIHAENNEPLNWASKKGHLEIIKYLEEKGADIHYNNDEPLWWAFGSPEVVKYLVEKGADIHIGNERTLIFMSAYGHLQLVKYLVEKGADVHAQNGLALICTGQKNHSSCFEVAKYLVSKGVNKNLIENERCLKYLNWTDKIRERKAIVIQRYWRGAREKI